MLAIQRAREKTDEIIPVMFNEIYGRGLKVYHVTRNQDNAPLFAYVNRLEYIKYLESKHQLIRKRAALRDVLRDCIRKS